MAKEVVLTREGFEKLKAEIEDLSTVRRREVAERIKEAREFGDISENSEYDDAKNEQAMLEAKIAQLEERLRDAPVIDRDDVSHRGGRRSGSHGHARDAGAARPPTSWSARPRPTRTRTGCRTSRRSGARSSATRRARRSTSSRRGGKIKVKIVTIKAA